MSNTIDTSLRFNYIPDAGLQQRERSQGIANTVQTSDVKSKAIGPQECETCKSRKYQDVSNDSSVSFKAATHVSPEMAATAVQSHEQQHVSHNAQTAKEQGIKAQSTVIIHTAICPECGKGYVSGGTTITRYRAEQNPSQQCGNIVDTLA
jgi:hypothetical protein